MESRNRPYNETKERFSFPLANMLPVAPTLPLTTTPLPTHHPPCSRPLPTSSRIPCLTTTFLLKSRILAIPSFTTLPYVFYVLNKTAHRAWKFNIPGSDYSNSPQATTNTPYPWSNPPSNSASNICTSQLTLIY